MSPYMCKSQLRKTILISYHVLCINSRSINKIDGVNYTVYTDPVGAIVSPAN